MALNYFGFNTKLVFSWQFAIRNLNSWTYDMALIFLSRYREKIARIWDCCSRVTDIYIRRTIHCFSFLFFFFLLKQAEYHCWVAIFQINVFFSPYGSFLYWYFSSWIREALPIMGTASPLPAVLPSYLA